MRGDSIPIAVCTILVIEGIDSVADFLVVDGLPAHRTLVKWAIVCCLGVCFMIGRIITCAICTERPIIEDDDTVLTAVMVYSPKGKPL